MEAQGALCGLGSCIVERTGSDGDKDHKDGSFGISVANGGRDGGKPLVRVAIPLVLHDLVVVEGASDDEGAKKGSWCRIGVVSI